MCVSEMPLCGIYQPLIMVPDRTSNVASPRAPGEPCSGYEPSSIQSLSAGSHGAVAHSPDLTSAECHPGKTALEGVDIHCIRLGSLPGLETRDLPE